LKITFIGCGKMGQALLKGILCSGYCKAKDIFVFDTNIQRLLSVHKTYKINSALSCADACKKSAIIILAVKPQDISKALAEASPAIKDKIIISIAAGVGIDYIKNKTRQKSIVRAMPNLPAIMGQAMTVLSYAPGVKTSDRERAKSIFKCIGKVLIMPEKYMDAITAVSGSGPAYVFLFMESLIKAAVSAGLPRHAARVIVPQVVYGSSFLQYSLNADPETLRLSVTSKGGTTEAALRIFQKRNFDILIKNAVMAACKRSKYLNRVR
jgi:pyrroline-5-carboxylate reductase